MNEPNLILYSTTVGSIALSEARDGGSDLALSRRVEPGIQPFGTR